MLLNNFKLGFTKRLNLLWIVLLPVSWLLGTQAIRNNIDFLHKAAQAVGESGNLLSADYANARVNSINGFMVFIEGCSDFYISLAVVLLSGIIFSSSFCYDKNTGFGNFILSRTDYNRYFVNKVLVTFAVPFLSVVLVMSAVLLCSLSVYSANRPTDDFIFSIAEGSESRSLFLSHWIMSCFIMIFVLGLLGGVYALFGMGVGVFTCDRLIISVSPVALYIMLTLIPQFFSVNGKFAKYVAWLFPSYLTGIFIGNDYRYTELSPLAACAVHFAVIIIPVAVFLTALYFKNKKQYIK